MANTSGTPHTTGKHKAAKPKAVPTAKGNKYPPNGIHKAMGKGTRY